MEREPLTPTDRAFVVFAELTGNGEPLLPALAGAIQTAVATERECCILTIEKKFAHGSASDRELCAALVAAIRNRGEGDA